MPSVKETNLSDIVAEIQPICLGSLGSANIPVAVKAMVYTIQYHCSCTPECNRGAPGQSLALPAGQFVPVTTDRVRAHSAVRQPDLGRPQEMLPVDYPLDGKIQIHAHTPMIGIFDDWRFGMYDHAVLIHRPTPKMVADHPANRW